MMQSDFLQLAHYDADTGKFTAVVSRGRRKSGDLLGYVKADGYRLISFKGRWYYAHRLAWYLATGQWPLDEIDHINGRRDDNRIANLRECSRSQNMMNTPKDGVCFHKGQNKWQASIRANGRRTHLGSFESKSQAMQAYQRAAVMLHGNFAFVEAPTPKAEQLSMLTE